MSLAGSQPIERRLVALSLLFFVSGAAALLFETLWFRLAGLTFGNAAWASATVLASFMAGLALGNVLALRFRGVPLRVYSAIETGVAIGGAALVFLLPFSTRVIAPLFRAAGDHPSVIAATRLTLAFVLMLIPTSLMGATLPTLVGAMGTSRFERVLGMLYGWNTLGAVCGAVAGELVFIERFGLRGTALVAMSCSLVAAAGAWMLSRETTGVPPVRIRGTRPPARLLAATAIAGFLLLALEVIWMRLTILFVYATTLAFAFMLAVILFGIGAGSLISAAIARRFENADAGVAWVAIAASIAVISTYRWFPAEKIIHDDLIFASVCLMLPVSFLSGVLFPWIGKQIERTTGEGTLAAAALTAANTLGGMAGSIIATFMLIPYLGIDDAIRLCAIGYLLIAVLVRAKKSALLPAVAVAVIIAVTPNDLLLRRFIPIATAKYRSPTTKIVAAEQGPIETAIYLETPAFGAPYTERLYTNGYSMSAYTIASKRYMSLFVHLPMAIRPSARSALLISYGVGVTAHALTSTPQLQSIDVVDISQTILGLSDVVFPGDANPLRDPRVRVHVEDGRFFLMTTPRRFDLITAEPPPPKCAGVVNLYTKEYFALLRDRLSDGGLATYWLPVYQLEPDEARSIVRAFCDELDDCTLWSGGGGEWILLGSRGPMRVAPSFAAPWQTPASAQWLSQVGVERPEMLGSLFLADTKTLRNWAASAPPLTDDFPLRLSSRVVPQDLRAWAGNLDARTRQQRFVASPLFSAEMKEAAAPYFGLAQVTDRRMFDPNGAPPINARAVQAILTRSTLRDAPRLLLGSDRWLEQLAIAAWNRGEHTPEAAKIVGIGFLCDRKYAAAAPLLNAAAKAMPNDRDAQTLAKLANELAK